MNPIIAHEGKKMRSGRYPWGSGDRPYQRLGGKGIFRKKTSEEKAAIENRKELKRNIRTMSTEDIRKNIERFQNERTLRNLIDSDISPGKKYIEEILINVGKDTATTVLKGSTKYLIDTSLREESFTLKGLAEAIYPRSKKKEKEDK